MLRPIGLSNLCRRLALHATGLEPRSPSRQCAGHDIRLLLLNSQDPQTRLEIIANAHTHAHTHWIVSFAHGSNLLLLCSFALVFVCVFVGVCVGDVSQEVQDVHACCVRCAGWWRNQNHETNSSQPACRHNSQPDPSIGLHVQMAVSYRIFHTRTQRHRNTCLYLDFRAHRQNLTSLFLNSNAYLQRRMS